MAQLKPINRRVEPHNVLQMRCMHQAHGFQYRDADHSLNAIEMTAERSMRKITD